MVTLHEGKQFIIDNERIATAEEAAKLSAEEGKKETLTYQVLAAHNHSGNMKNLEIQFDSMGVYDNTYVGILQTAYASGLKEFPMPCVFTNCHNCLCAVGGTINTDVHKYAESACKKSGGIFVPPHEAVIHQYMREMIVKSGGMSIVSDSHTRYGTQGSISIGEGGPELAKAMLGKYYEIEYPGVIAVFLTGKPKPWVGPMDVALSIIGKVFKNNFVKNKILEFVGPGVSSMSMDFRNGIDTMTTESACLSSVWATDEQTKRYFEIHKRPDDFKEMKPGHAAMYDGIVEINLDTIVPMIALPFHPSNAYPLADVIADPEKYMTRTEKEAEHVFENNKDIHLDLHSKIRNGKIKVDQAAIAGCAAGSFENIFAVDRIAKKMNHGLGTFPFNIYPASQPIMYELNKIGVLNDLMNYGVRVKTAFCGPCFGASDAPGNNDFCIRHSTRNFPNREGSKLQNGQIASVALMDARSIAATAANKGVLTPATEFDGDFGKYKYHFDSNIYKNRVFDSHGVADESVEIQFGPNIKDWPAMGALPENLVLQVVSEIHDPVTTTDELIPSGETSSYRSNPLGLAEFTLSRKDPQYVGRAKEIQKAEKERMNGGHPCQAVPVLKDVMGEVKKQYPEADRKNTGFGSTIFAVKPGDGSAREQAASCQKVLGGWANIANEYATKRYRSNLINWGMLPFLIQPGDLPFKNLDYLFVPGIKKAVEDKTEEIKAYVVTPGEGMKEFSLKLGELTDEERQIILKGCLINYNRV